MDFNVKKLVGDAGSFLSRAVQMTEEAIYAGEKTTLDPQLEGLSRQVDSTKTWTQRIAKDLDTVLVPNPGYRVEDYLFEKIEKKRPARLSNMECLGQGMLEAGNEFGASGAYGSMLIKVGQNELKLGQAERDFINGAVNAYVEPLNKFIDNEIKNATRERRTLENKRLDLDAAKNRLRKARSLSSTGQPAKDGTDPRVLIQQAEREVIAAQSEFTQQADVVRAQLDLVILGRDRHVEHLKALVAAQSTYYDRCQQLMVELNRELHTMPLHSVNLNQSFSLDDSTDEGINVGMKGKVMYDYTAKEDSEISLTANEILIVEDSLDSEFFIAKKGTIRGKVPKACVLLI